ncbi:MAG: MGMT family protein [Candidatus Cloacimonetes bacterium]|nr:MGMT family protein [Candidatus Cloacimonadota bacterium]
MNEFNKNIIKIIKNIPDGKVISYGRIATLSGNPRASRQVARILHSSSEKYDLPWHRVVNSQRKISLKNPIAYEQQKNMLQNEGIIFTLSDVIKKEFFWEISVIEAIKL